MVFALPHSARERAAACPGGLADVLNELEFSLKRESPLEGVRLGAVLSAVGRRSYGPLLLVLGLFAISPATILPGMTSLTALVTLLVALQMLAGFKRPWLPKSVLDIRTPRRALFAFLDRVRPMLERADGVWLRPRWTFLTTAPAVMVVAACVAGAALITLPLSLVPFAPLAPGLAIVLFGLCVVARHGLWLGAGASMTIAACALAAPMLL